MFRALRFILLLAFAAAIFGCAGQAKTTPLTNFPNRADRFDIRFAWETHATAGSLTVEGVAKNVRYAYVEDLSLQISLLDRNQRVLAQETYFFIPSQIQLDDSAPFTVALKAAAPPGAQLEFLYRYRFTEGMDHSRWEGLFTSDLATGAVRWPE
ncbi:hypothetical protein LPW11_05545 [Geomonas sp. RF6]|uniref:hypothetical protein n=1 Tax=Geomonas sp. RF6 TaxID=2897342 RepID=UPI001E417C8F|nr:hypothetical protein [Geomonas sp. RF6]UFS71657.1 hypothetical protein LPW11_05545 [Geomonas sp. RF6]